MPKKSKLGKTRHDKWYNLAKEQGYRSRASFKLVQLNKKYDFLSSSRALLDLCAAPGGWLQVAQKYMPAGSLIIGIDLLPIKPIPGVVTLQQDILTAKCRQLIKKESQGWKFDTVIHDGAPNVGGNSWVKDAYGQIELVLHSLRLSTEFLKPGGHFITKVFRSQDYNALLWVMQQFFKKVDVTKPAASRDTSAEIYIAGLGYLAPKSIDPRLLDPAHVFRTADTAAKPVDVLTGKSSSKPNRSGYADGARVLFSEATVAEFVEADDPVEMLGRMTRLRTDDEASRPYLEHVLTTEDIKVLLDDLKVLGKRDFRTILKWRGGMRGFRRELLAASASAAAGGDDEADGGGAAAAAEAAAAVSLSAREEEERRRAALTPEEREAEDDAQLAAELEELQRRQRHKLRVARRKKREEKFKARKRAAMSAHASDLREEEDQEEGMFSLRAIPNARALRDVADQGDAVELLSSSSEADDEVPTYVDEDDETRRARMRVELDALYSQFKERRKIRSRRDRKREKAVGFFEGEGDEDEEALRVAGERAAGPAGMVDGDSDDDDDDSGADGAENPLVVPLGAGKIGSTPEARAARWFDGDLFDGLDAGGKAAAAAGAGAAAGRKRKRDSDGDSSSSGSGSGGDGDGDDIDAAEMAGTAAAAAPARGRKAKAAAARAAAAAAAAASDSDSEDADPAVRKRKRLAKQSGFEEVSEDSLTDYSDDSDARAEVLALGQRFLHKKSRQTLEDAAYNKYAWGAEEELPEWFVNNEEMHNKPEMPVTKEEVDLVKAQLQAINARPAKKIAEARARKKMKKVARLEKVKAQADSIAKNDGLSGQEKVRSIEKLYRGVKGKKKKVERKYVVARKSGGQLQAEARRGFNGPVKVVDARMKTDKRGERRAAKKKKGAKRSRK